MNQKGDGKVGRASKCTTDLIKITRGYIDNFKTEYNHEMPSVAGLSIITGIQRKTFYEWIKYAKDPERADDKTLHDMVGELDTINTRQELELLNNGLNGSFNSQITKLALGKHGYHDKQDSTLAAPDGGPVKTTNQFIFNPVGPDYEPAD